MIETGVVVDLDGVPIHWHLPEGRTAVYLPDTPDLWDVLWAHRDRVLGFAHSHPGHGTPGPSMEDLTTFAAVESGLGLRLVWWITSSDRLVEITWRGPGRLDYVSRPIGSEGIPGRWLRNLRDISYAER